MNDEWGMFLHDMNFWEEFDFDSKFEDMFKWSVRVQPESIQFLKRLNRFTWWGVKRDGIKTSCILCWCAEMCARGGGIYSNMHDARRIPFLIDDKYGYFICSDGSVKPPSVVVCRRVNINPISRVSLPSISPHGLPHHAPLHLVVPSSVRTYPTQHSIDDVTPCRQYELDGCCMLIWTVSSAL